MKKIAIVTVSYNSSKHTNDLLRSLERADLNDLDLKIFIVDNGSYKKFHPLKDTDSHHSNHNSLHDHVSIIRSEKNLGFAGGFNLGIKEALDQGAEYILILNNDTKVYSDMIQKLLQTLDSNPQIGVVVPKIYFATGHEFHKKRYKENELGKVIWYAGGSTDWDNIKSVHRGVDEVDNGQYDEIEPTEFATGCCIFFKREVLEKVGLFNEKYFLYYEDADLSERIKKTGYKIFYTPTACLIHSNAASSGGPGNNLHDYFLTRNQMFFGFTYAPLRSKLALIRQSIRYLLFGRPMQRKGIIDFYLKKFGHGSFFEK